MRPTTAPADNVVDINALLQPGAATEHPSYDIVLKPRGRGRWKWVVRGADGDILMSGSECSRAAADGPRYKALGNSMATHVIRWIGQRIQRHLQETA